ncbi:MAG: hypothetical protein WAX89_05695 [Alphaproteobacteria bacterium]
MLHNPTDASAPVPTFPNLRMEVMRITPALAQEWLDKYNTKNRPVSQRKVAGYTHIMRAKKWGTHGKAIGFAPNGRLLNGQHRLKAVVASGVTITNLVIWGIAEEAFATMDSGQRRNANHVLARMGCPLATRTTSAIRLLNTYSKLVENPALRNPNDVTIDDIRSFYLANKEIDADVKLAHVLELDKLVVPSVGIALCTLIRQAGYDDMKDRQRFFRILMGKVELRVRRDKAIELLQRRWQAEGRRTKHTADVPATTLLVYGIRAFNAWARADSISALYGPDLAVGRSFPTIDLA